MSSPVHNTCAHSLHLARSTTLAHNLIFMRHHHEIPAFVSYCQVFLSVVRKLFNAFDYFKMKGWISAKLTRIIIRGRESKVVKWADWGPIGEDSELNQIWHKSLREGDQQFWNGARSSLGGAGTAPPRTQYNECSKSFKIQNSQNHVVYSYRYLYG